MIIRITKSPDSYNQEEDSVTRAKLKEYLFRLECSNGTTIEEVITISDTEEVKKPEETAIDIFSENVISSDQVSISGEIEYFPEPIAQFVAKQTVKDLFNYEKINQELIQLTISSEFPDLLELNWEKIIKDTHKENYSLVQWRMTESANKKSMANTDSLNTLMLLSYSNEDYHYNHEKIFDHFKNESQEMVSAFFSNFMRDKNKPNIITIARYINKDSIKLIPLNTYSLLHISAHGLPRKIGFEDVNHSNIIDWLDASELNYIQGHSDHKYKVVFLAICNGANSVGSAGSIAYELIRNSLAETVVAFQDEAGSEISIPTFAKYFYEFLMKSYDPQKSYNETIKRITKIREVKKLKPIFYTSYE